MSLAPTIPPTPFSPIKRGRKGVPSDGEAGKGGGPMVPLCPNNRFVGKGYSDRADGYPQRSFVLKIFKTFKGQAAG